MEKITYTRLINKTLEIYMKGDYLEAYHFITKNYHGIKSIMAQIYNFRFAIASKAGLTKLALQIMNEAVKEKGFWYSYNYLIEDEDLEPLKKYKAFGELVEICKKREIEAKRKEKPELKIILSNKMNELHKHPLMLTLHGDQENIDITEDYWISCIQKNYIVALPQSSQIQFSEGYEWKDIDKGSQELKSHCDKLLKKYNIDFNLSIIGGFSAGGRVALYSVLKDIINVKGFILIAPWLPEIEDWLPLMNNLKERNLRGYLVCGDKDNDCYECTKRFSEILSVKNIPHRLKICKGLDHEYPDNFNEILQNAFDYILEK